MPLSKDITELLNYVQIDPTVFLEEDNLAEQQRLEDDDMAHYIINAKNMINFNNYLYLIQPTQCLQYDYNQLNAHEYKENATGSSAITYKITFLLRGEFGENTIKKTFNYHEENGKIAHIFAFQTFPDNRAYKMVVEVIFDNTTYYGEFDMRPHPSLNCAYYYGDIKKELYTLCNENSVTECLENTKENLHSKIYLSEQDNPFTFPLEHRYTFQSKVLGVAVASTALSQGQFGQFPLYVFTEDGIWAMETASDGSFVSQKPLSRDVCINPDSITPIDNAVVFVTAKGVMMIQGSDVANISPYMNGRHYTPNASAKNLIGKQEGFSALIDAVFDEDAFIAFMKDAKVAFDYPGQRLIFMSAANTGFQYIYNINTQTWHKTSFEDIDLETPLNSYPECFVLGKKENKTAIFSITSVLDSSIEQNTAKGILITRPFDLGLPDVYKSITSIKIRGDYDKGNVRYFLQGSDNGRDFYTLNSLRGKSWKMFRIFILADLEPTERISWIDVDFEPRYQNRLR